MSIVKIPYLGMIDPAQIQKVRVRKPEVTYSPYYERSKPVREHGFWGKWVRPTHWRAKYVQTAQVLVWYTGDEHAIRIECDNLAHANRVHAEIIFAINTAVKAPIVERIVSVAIILGWHTLMGEDYLKEYPGDPIIISKPAPARHHHVIHEVATATGEPVHPLAQGFVTSTGRFVDRREGMTVALMAGQLLDPTKIATSMPQLYSEDLW
jgi:hypothetical protein